MEFWFKRQMEKIELTVKDIQMEFPHQKFNCLIHKLKKYRNCMPWKPIVNAHENYSIATTPFSNYSIISSNSLVNNSPVNNSLNNAFYIYSSRDPSCSPNENDKKTPKHQENYQQFKEEMTISEKEELLLKQFNTGNNCNSNTFSRHSVKLEDLLNVTKNAEDSSIDCDFLKDASGHKKKEEKNKKIQNSLEKLLKTLNFTCKLSENKKEITKKEEDETFFECGNKKIIKNLNREIYQHFGQETLSFSNSFKSSSNIPKNENKMVTFKGKCKSKDVLKKVPRLNLENLQKDIENMHSCSPSYRKKAERSQYLREIFLAKEKEKMEKRKNKHPNKSMDFSNKPINFNYFQSRINEKANDFINNVVNKKHVKNNYSLIEISNKEDSFHQRRKSKIGGIQESLKKKEKDDGPLRDKTNNFLNIVAPTNNINVFISGEFEEKECTSSNNSRNPKKNNRLMKLLSQVNQSRKEGKVLKENFCLQDFSLGSIMGALKEKDKGKIQEEFSFLRKMRNNVNLK